MNILILNWRDIKHPLAGGAEISLLEHARIWKKKGATITWFSSNFAGGKKEEEIDGIKIYRRGSHYTVHVWAFIYYLRGIFTKVDIIVDCFHFIPYFSNFYINRKAKIIALINEVAGKVWFSNIAFPIASLGFFIEPYILLTYKKNIFVTGSESTRDEVVDIGIPDKNVHVIHHGISVKQDKNISKKEAHPVIVFLGRISKDKGIDEALEVFREIRKKNRNAKFWIIGKEEKSGIIQKMKQKEPAQIRNNIMYYGFVDEKKKFELLKRSWILIHPSYKEGWGLNVIEANSVGIPTVGYNVSGLKDSVQHGKTGLLTIENTPKSMAEAVLELINNKGLYKKISYNAIMWSKKFRWKQSGEKSWELIKTIHNDKKQN